MKPWIHLFGSVVGCLLLTGATVSLAQNLEDRVRSLEENMQALGAEKTSETMRAFWKNDLRFQTLDKQVEIRIGGRIQNDWNFYLPGDDLEAAFGDPEDRIFFRRARLFIRGTLYESIKFKAEFDFATGEPVFTDVYVEFADIPYVGNILFGKFKTPFGLEELTSSRFITFQERSLTDAFVLGRQVGVLFANDLFDGRLTWAFAVTRPDNDFGDTIAESLGGDYNATVRITGLPWRADKSHLAHLGFAYSFRNPGNNEFRLRARPEARIDGLRLVDTGTFNADQAHQLGFEGAVVYGPLSFQGEFMLAFPQLVDSTADDPTFWVFYVMGSYFLTGEHRPYDGNVFGRPHPRHNFNLKKGGWGAWEVAARFSWVDLDDAADLDPSSGGVQRDVTFGINWYPNPNTRVTWNYVYANVDRTLVDGTTVTDLDGESAHIVQMRFQVDF